MPFFFQLLTISKGNFLTNCTSNLLLRGAHTMMRLKQAIKLLHALVLAINKATCGQDNIISQIKEMY